MIFLKIESVDFSPLRLSQDLSSSSPEINLEGKEEDKKKEGRQGGWKKLAEGGMHLEAERLEIQEPI